MHFIYFLQFRQNFLQFHKIFYKNFIRQNNIN